MLNIVTALCCWTLLLHLVAEHCDCTFLLNIFTAPCCWTMLLHLADEYCYCTLPLNIVTAPFRWTLFQHLAAEHCYCSLPLNIVTAPCCWTLILHLAALHFYCALPLTIVTAPCCWTLLLHLAAEHCNCALMLFTFLLTRGRLDTQSKTIFMALSLKRRKKKENINEKLVPVVTKASFFQRFWSQVIAECSTFTRQENYLLSSSNYCLDNCNITVHSCYGGISPACWYTGFAPCPRYSWSSSRGPSSSSLSKAPQILSFIIQSL